LIKADEFIHILRVQNTNVDGKRKATFAFRAIKGIGRRFANLVLKIAQIDCNKRYESIIISYFSPCL
jgi:small subunit ribosomal protein S18e